VTQTITLLSAAPVPIVGGKLILKRHRAALRGSLFFQRYGIGLVLWGLLIQQRDQFATRGRDADLALADNLFSAEASAIELSVCTAIRPKRRALKRNPGEQAARARIASHLGQANGLFIYLPAGPKQDVLQLLVHSKGGHVATINGIREAARARDPDLIVDVTKLENNLELVAHASADCRGPLGCAWSSGAVAGDHRRSWRGVLRREPAHSRNRHSDDAWRERARRAEFHVEAGPPAGCNRGSRRRDCLRRGVADRKTV
jgi:hypothetical protein